MLNIYNRQYYIYFIYSLFYVGIVNLTWNVPDTQREGPVIVCLTVMNDERTVSTPVCVSFIVTVEITKVSQHNVA